MKDIYYTKEGTKDIFNFFFKNSAQILMSILGGSMICSFTLLYLLKPYSSISDDSYFFLSFFIASLISLKMYNRYKWLSTRKRIEITDDEILYYDAETLINKIGIKEVSEIVKERKVILIFPLNTIAISGDNDSIRIYGFKTGDDLENTFNSLKDIISQKNQE